MFRESDQLAIVLQNEDFANYTVWVKKNVLGQNVLPGHRHLDYFSDYGRGPMPNWIPVVQELHRQSLELTN